MSGESHEIKSVVVDGREVPAHLVVCPECQTLWLDVVVETGDPVEWVLTCPHDHTWTITAIDLPVTAPAVEPSADGCGVGKGAACCRLLVIGRAGFECTRGTAFGLQLAGHEMGSQFVPSIDDCQGERYLFELRLATESDESTGAGPVS